MAKIKNHKTITFSPQEYEYLQEANKIIHALWSEMESNEYVAANSEYTVGVVDDFLFDLVDALKTKKDVDDNYTIEIYN